MRSIVHLSDIHFGRVNADVIAPLIDAIGKISPDLVAVSGDLTQRARSRQFAEARAFLDHPILGPRLIACCDALLPHLRGGKAAAEVLGDVDALKLGSSMEIFHEADGHELRFAELLALARQ